MKKLLLLILLLPLLGLGCQRLGAGVPKAVSTVEEDLTAEQTEWIKTHDKYKEIKPFVGKDGKVRRVDSIVKWNGEGQEPTKSFQIIVIEPVDNTTTTI